MSTQKKRREHYVPKFYLDSFGETLFVFDKLTGNSFKTVSKNIALEHGFYEVTPEADLEGMIAQNEGNMHVGFSELIEKLNPDAISREARIRVALFVALQYVRSKEFRAWLKESGEKLATEMIRADPEFKEEEFKITMKDELAQALQAERMVDDTIPKLGYRLGHSRWALLLNKTPIPFWTSDNPVALFNPIDYGDKSGVGFAVRGIQIHFPINSKLSLTILDPTSYNTPPVNAVDKDEAVVYENKLQLFNATRFVISSNDDFAIAKKMRDEDERLRQPQERVVLRTIKVGERSFIQLSNTMKMPQSADGKRT